MSGIFTVDQWLSIALCVFTALVATIVTYSATSLQSKRARELAEQSGAFRYPDLTFSLFGEALSTSVAENPVFTFCHQGNDESISAYPLDFVVTNNGEATCDDLVLLLHATAYLLPPFSHQELECTISPGVYKDNVQREIVKLGHLNQVSYRLPPLHPKSRFRLCDYCFLPATIHHGSVSATTVDKQSVEVGYVLGFRFRLSLTLLARDSIPQSYYFAIDRVSASSPKDAALKLMGSWSEECAADWKRASLMGKFKLILVRKRMPHSIVIGFEDFTTHTAAGHTVLEMIPGKALKATVGERLVRK